MTSNKIETVSCESFIKILDILNNLNFRYWVDGGWGIDVLIGFQTREHRDIDIDFDASFEQQLLDKLLEIGYEITTDLRPCRIELWHPDYAYIDIHPFEILETGEARQADLEGGWYNFEPDIFASTIFEGREVPCISADSQRLFHSGYELREIDKIDMANLDKYYPIGDSKA